MVKNYVKNKSDTKYVPLILKKRMGILPLNRANLVDMVSQFHFKFVS